MRHPLGVLLASILLAVPAASAAARRCAGTLSGDVTGRFECEVRITTTDGERLVLEIVPRTIIDLVPSYVPGAFDVTGLLKPGTYGLDELGVGKASVAVEGGALYTAAKTSSQRGEVRLELTAVESPKGKSGSWTVHGKYRARLVPAGGGKSGEVVVEASF